MGGDAHFGDMVHFIGPNLDFQRFPLDTDHRRVQGLVHVRFRYGNEILEPVGNRFPQGMDHAQRAIALLERVNQNPHGRQVVNLAELFVIPLHFAKNAVKMFRTAVDLGLDADFAQLLPQNHNRFLDDGFPLLALLPDLVHQLVVFFRLQIPERQILQLPFDVGYAQSVRQRCEDLQGFPGDLFLLLRCHRLERPHIVEPVRQFDQNHADVLCHRQEHLAVVFHLLFFFGLILDPAQFGDAVNQAGNLPAEFLFNLLQGHRGIFDYIMQQRRRDGVGVDLQFRQDPGHAQRVVDIVFAGNPVLSLMGLRSQGKGFLQQRNDSFRLIRANLGNNVGNVRSLLAGHSRTPSRKITVVIVPPSPGTAWTAGTRCIPRRRKKSGSVQTPADPHFPT